MNYRDKDFQMIAFLIKFKESVHILDYLSRSFRWTKNLLSN